MITGVPAKERLWLWIFLIWIILAGGPVLNLVGKPVWVGLFPLLYVWSIAFYVLSLILTAIFAYKLTFHAMPENIVSIYDELQLDPTEDLFKQLEAKGNAQAKEVSNG